MVYLKLEKKIGFMFFFMILFLKINDFKNCLCRLYLLVFISVKVKFNF